jgi:hypothetical protein
MTLKFWKNYKPTHILATTKYLYTSPFCQGAKVIATYVDGHLSELQGIHHIGILWEGIPINAPIPFKETEVEKMASLYDYAIMCRKIETSGTGGKVSAFCSAYKKYTGLSYKVLKGEPQKIEDLKVDETLFELYFTNREWWGKQPKSIRNFATNYNALLQLQAVKAKGPQHRFPNEPDMEFQKTLPTKEWAKLWKHWRDNGYHPVKGRNGETIGWKKAALLTICFIVFSLLSGCGLLKKAATSIFTDTTVPDTVMVPVEVRVTDTIYLRGDTLITDWLVLEEGDTVLVEDSTMSVQVMEADSASWWAWFDGQPEAAKPDILKKKPRLIRVKAVQKPIAVPFDTTLKQEVKVPVPSGPVLPIGDPAKWGTLQGVLMGVLGLGFALLFYFLARKKRKDGQD